ncbi:MAG TPA: S41 family peptidase [Bdellovibrionota bacterium]|nr:S41 family peptidase [Bdellovibrionota bacterium]
MRVPGNIDEIFRALFASIALGLVAVGCGGTKKQEAEKAPAAPDQQLKIPLITDELLACQEFAFSTQFVLYRHLTRKPSEHLSLVAAAYKSWLDKYAKDTKDPKEKELAAKLSSESPATIDSCDLILSLGSTLTSLAKKEDPTIYHLRRILGEFMDQLDIHSGYELPSSIVGPLERKVSWRPKLCGAGLTFRRRSDYLLGRPPAYLIVDGAFTDSENTDAVTEGGKVPIGSRILAIRTEDGMKKVPDFCPADDDECIPYFKAVAAIDEREQSECAPEGTRYVHVEVQRPGETDTEGVDLNVGRFTPLHQKTWVRTYAPYKIAYIRLASFSLNAKVDMRDARQKISNENFQGLILDLRGNPGGQIDEAMSVSEMFLDQPESTVAITFSVTTSPEYVDAELRGKGLHRSPYTVDPIDERIKQPLVVLVDRMTGSAAEIVAAAFQDYKRALIVGETTWGKGIGQSTPDLNPFGGLLSVTSAFWYSPRGTSYHLEGVAPDILVADGEDPFNAWAIKQFGRPGHEKDYLTYKDGKYAGRVIPKPPTFDRMETISAPTSPAISDSDLDKLHHMQPPPIQDCRPITSSSDIREESDCSLQWGIEYLKELIRIKRTPTTTSSHES